MGGTKYPCKFIFVGSYIQQNGYIIVSQDGTRLQLLNDKSQIKLRNFQKNICIEEMNHNKIQFQFEEKEQKDELSKFFYRFSEQPYQLQEQRNIQLQIEFPSKNATDIL
ncbi:hypothetical protein PPERSA_06878 [Pseudocohnilembus persalinus]|uniref:Uncharacterized protein n=1 Tax=Pseudocohnilembus persalinus TaxID=266149 RepID=A0A0V0QSJ1_PSEPJ|nr:hypothetical protein PPERSA_06878 [Pseudocohnilembus persalinus]|eukprot:KRX05244.1 hypothetical protein PPERSA_06878 [Pseudocohnilembus persalinus]